MNVFRCVLFIIFMIFTCTAQEIGVALQCPKLFRDGENIIICKINITAVEANCKLKYDYVMFEWNDNTDKASVCRSVYNTTKKCATGDGHSPGSCWCAESSGEVFTYKCSYLANSTRDKGRQLTCSLCFLPQKHLNISISDGCKNMTFDNHEDSGTDNKLKPANSDVGLVLGVGLGVLMLLVITGIYIKKRQRLPSTYFCKTKKDSRRTSAVKLEQKELMSSTSKEGNQSGRQQNGHFSVQMPNGK